MRQIKCRQRLFREQLSILLATFRSITLLSSIRINNQQQHRSCPIFQQDQLWEFGSVSMVTTSYMIDGTQQVNGSDNRLLDVALDGALGCTPLMAPDLAHPGQMTTALPLNELHAAAQQAAPRALVPRRDPMTMVDTNTNTR